jgi:hypothetical protein
MNYEETFYFYDLNSCSLIINSYRLIFNSSNFIIISLDISNYFQRKFHFI